MENKTEKFQIQETFSFYRGLIMDLLEQDYGTQTNWQFVRNRLLKILSANRGLEGKIIEILDKSKSGDSK